MLTEWLAKLTWLQGGLSPKDSATVQIIKELIAGMDYDRSQWEEYLNIESDRISFTFKRGSAWVSGFTDLWGKCQYYEVHGVPIPVAEDLIDNIDMFQLEVENPHINLLRIPELGMKIGDMQGQLNALIEKVTNHDH